MSVDASVEPRVLIVDDNATMRALIAQILRSEDMVAVQCAGGREALAVLNTGHFDAVILDIMMPDLDGYEVLRQMQSTSRTAGLPVIILSAKSTDRDVEQGLKLGARYYLTKPFNKYELVRKLRACIEGT